MEKTFEKNDNAGRFAERFLPSLRAPAFWEVVPLTMGDYDEFTIHPTKCRWTPRGGFRAGPTGRSVWRFRGSS